MDKQKRRLVYHQLPLFMYIILLALPYIKSLLRLPVCHPYDEFLPNTIALQDMDLHAHINGYLNFLVYF
jgi:hypothetical protein